ncbi:MAG: SWIM zinc finger family protein [Ignavibacteriales bacterium]
MKGTIEIILKSEEARIGRAVRAVIEKSYKINVLKNESHEVRAYVQKETKVYAVLISDSGKRFCSCHDAFVNENVCKHILMVFYFTYPKLQ